MEATRRRPEPTPQRTAEVVTALGALAQETRLEVYRRLIAYAPQGLTPGALALQLKLPPATLSFHLKELVNAGLVTSDRDGRFLWYRPDVAAMNRVLGYLTENCCRASGESCAPGCGPAACDPAPASQKGKR